MAKLLTQSSEFNSNYHNMSFKNVLSAWAFNSEHDYH